MFLHISRQSGNVKEKEKDIETENETFFVTLLVFIERYYPKQTTNVAWSGTDSDLTTQGTDGKIKCALAVVWMIVERWLAELE